MGFLKGLFVQEVQHYDPVLDQDDVQVANEPSEINVSNVNASSMIADVYAINGVTDLSQSIFKVEEIMNNLPKEMPTDTKRQTVRGILSSFAINISEVIVDGDNRQSMIKSALDEMKAYKEEEIADAATSIENYKKAIADLEKKITEAEEQIEESSNVADKECKRIADLIAFVGGEV